MQGVDMLEKFSQANANDKDRLLEYLRPDQGNCLYLYLDIDMYEIGGGIITVWIQENAQSIDAVVMQYKDSFQLYASEPSADAIYYQDIVRLIQERKPVRISAPSFIIKRLLPDVSDSYDDSYGVVMEMKKYRRLESEGIEVREASRSEIPEAVKVVLMDEMFSQSYEFDIMVKQFEDRFDSGEGTSFIIRKDGEVVAHLGLSAIGKEFAIASYTVVHPDERGYPFGAFLDSHLINEVIPSMGKKCFAFMQEPRRIKLFEIMGNPTVGEYGKLLMKCD